MKRSILLQIETLTRVKEKTLHMVLDTAVSEANIMMDHVPKFNRFTDFHSAVYSVCRSKTSLNSQLVCDIERQVWLKKGKKIKGITLKFNVPRNCKTFDKSMPFVKFSVYSKRQISLPIKKNRNFQRYYDLIKNGWECKTYGLTPNLEIVAYLSKDDESSHDMKNVLGIDVNSKCFAISVISPDGRVLHQDYFGKDIWVKRKRIFERKSILQSYADIGSGYAATALKRTKRKEHNFVKNRIGEVVKEIISLAIKYDAEIAIENLKRFKRKGRRFNREVMRIPFFTFRKNLASRCFDKGIPLKSVDSWHTSKWCSHCGAVGNGHSSSNYTIFSCNECGVVVNSDRKASLAVAIKSLLERKIPEHNNSEFFQISKRRVPVNGLIKRPDTVISQIVAVQHDSYPMESRAL